MKPFTVATPVLLTLLVFISSTSRAAHPLDDLEVTYPLPTTQELNNAAYGNGTWVIVGNSGFVLTSTDAVNWQTGSVGVVANLKDVIFENNIFIAVGAGRVLTSPDGVNWTEQASGIGAIDAGIAYGDGVYVVAGTNGNLRSSPDLVNWTIIDPGHTTHFFGIGFGAGRFVAVGNAGTITQGTVGGTWVTTNPTTLRLNDVVFGDNLFVVSGHSGTIVTAPDGINWTVQASIGTSALFSIKFGDGVFVASGNYSGSPTPYSIYRSTNGMDWTGVASTRLSDFTDGGGYGNGRFILLSRNFIQTSTDGQDWDFSSSPPMFVPTWADYLNVHLLGPLPDRSLEMSAILQTG